MNRYWLADSLIRVRTPNVFLQLEFSPSAPTRILVEYSIASPFRMAVTPNCPFGSCLMPRNDVDSCRTPPLLDSSSLREFRVRSGLSSKENCAGDRGLSSRMSLVSPGLFPTRSRDQSSFLCQELELVVPDYPVLLSR